MKVSASNMHGRTLCHVRSSTSSNWCEQTLRFFPGWAARRCRVLGPLVGKSESSEQSTSVTGTIRVDMHERVGFAIE